ncbi:MAG TPA: hypothetical protein VH502_07010 [Actinoplanes sp.]|jgi:hypothetical protein
MMCDDVMSFDRMPPAAGVPDATPILVGIVGAASADTALRAGLDHADACGAPVCVVCAGPAPAADDALLCDLIERWAEKYPRVRVTTKICRSIDAAVTLTAASRSCRAVVLGESSEPAVAAVFAAVARRARCPVFVDNERLNGH